MNEDDDDLDLFSKAHGGDEGSFRTGDPETSKEAARSIKASRIMKKILGYLQHQTIPRNGWEMAHALDMPTISVVPRLVVMRDDKGWIELVGTSLNPDSGRMQNAYIITPLGRDVLAAVTN